MDGFLKKYFWVVNLAVVAMCAIFAGRAGAHLVEATYFVGDLKGPPRRVATGPVTKVHGKEPDDIIKRNVFCSGCAPIQPVAQSAAEQSAHKDEPQKTSLQIELVSTMICPDDDTWSVAIIRELSTKEKDPGMFAKDSQLPSGATVVRVETHRVYLRNGGQLEYLEMEGATPPPNAVVEATPTGLDPAMGDIDKGVNCTGTNCTVDRALVDKLLANTMSLASAARFVPSIKDGKPNGFKLYAIRPNSIFGKIGLQNGDTIKVINGNEMTTPDAALGLYSKLRSASHLSVQVERRGETVTLDYTIR